MLVVSAGVLLIALAGTATVIAWRALAGPARSVLGGRAAPARRVLPSAFGSHRTVLLAPAPRAGEGLSFVGKAGEDATGYPYRAVDPLPLRALLHARRFAELTVIVERLQADAEQDPTRENWALGAVGAFAYPDPALEVPLDAWVAAHRESFAPHAARCAYEGALAWQARGGEWLRDTSREHLAAWDRHRERVQGLCDRALARNPRAYGAHLEVIGDHVGDTSEVYRRALAALPRSYEVRRCMIWRVSPRWGGSEAQMQEIAASGLRDLAQNRRFAWLPGDVELMHHYDAIAAKDPAGALAAIERALTHGESGDFLFARAELRRDAGDRAGALADLDRALELWPLNARLHYARGSLRYELGRREEAARDLVRAVELGPAKNRRHQPWMAEVISFRGEELLGEGRPLEAEQWIERALAVDPKCERALKARALLAANPPGRAPEQVEAARARAAQEDSFEAYRALDQVLAERGRFAEIIEQWTQYLARHPQDGRAFLERAGTHTHLRAGLSPALADARRACSLGVQAGCQLARKIENRQRRDAARAP